jgi:methylenetetrahydrofolate reductase (NADPH)
MSLELSIEFFPPQTEEGMEKLRATRQRLAVLKPEFFSVTYGAGGSTRERTLATVMEIAAEGHSAAPHLSCIGSTRAGIREMLHRIHRARHPPHRRPARRPALGHGRCRRIPLRQRAGRVHPRRNRRPLPHRGGRLPRVASAGEEPARRPAEFQAQGRRRRQFGHHPVLLQRRRLRALRRRKRARSASAVPIVPGIMPIASFSKLARFSDACGAEIPRWMRRKFESFGDDSDSIRAFGLDVVTELCQRLIERGAPGLHFYSA